MTVRENPPFHSLPTKVVARRLGRNPTKQSPLQLWLEICISSNSRNLLQILQRRKKENLIRKPHPLPYCLRNPYRNLKSENSQDYAQKPQRNLTFMNSASVNASRVTEMSFLISPQLHYCKADSLFLFIPCRKMDGSSL